MIFVDTSAFYALADKSDSNHKKAATFQNSLLKAKTPLLTTNYVISETYTLIRTRLGHAAAVRVIEGIKESDLVEIVHVPIGLEEEAWDILKSQADKDYSYVDAVSFVVMGSRKLSDAFTFDEHFQQYGFEGRP